jgi:hypothetical protein
LRRRNNVAFVPPLQLPPRQSSQTANVKTGEIRGPL